MGFSNAMNIGNGLVGGLGSIMEGQAKSRSLGHERDVLQTQVGLDLMKADKTTRKAVGSEISRVAGSGVQLDLEDLARLESEYLLDEAIIQDEGRVKDRELRSDQKTAKRMGRYKAIPSLVDAGEGLNKIRTRPSLGNKPTGLGAWLQT